MARPRSKPKRRRQRGRGYDIQNLLGKTGIEFHWPGYQYMGPGTKLKKTTETRRPGHQSIGQDRQTTRHRLQSRSEFTREVESGHHDDQGY